MRVGDGGRDGHQEQPAVLLESPDPGQALAEEPVPA